MLLEVLGGINILWSWKGFLGRPGPVITLAGPLLHHQMQQQDTAHSLIPSARDEEGLYKSTPTLW